MKFKYSTSLLIIGLLMVSSCVKLDEGPGFSLLTKKQRLAREWVIDSLTVENSTTGIQYVYDNEQMKDLRLIFDKEFNLAFYYKDDSGFLLENFTSWNWFRPGYMIEVNFMGVQLSHIAGMRKYIVKRLTRNELILEDFGVGSRLYFHAF